jgi:two-component system, chemotaxis family, chemotaxis protein CheY
LTDSADILNVLVVDDMPEIRKILRHFILHTLRAQVTEAENGLDAVAKCLDNPPDLIFCDLNMPEMTGFEFLGFLTRQKNRPICPIIVLTTDADEKTRIQASGLYVDALLQKPFDPGQVMKALTEHVPPGFFLPS